jgi:hypothetical protein
VAGFVDEFAELFVGDGRAVDPELADLYQMRRCLFWIMPAGSHAERAAWDENLVARRLLKHCCRPALNSFSSGSVTGGRFQKM